MKAPALVIIGAGGHGREMLEAVRAVNGGRRTWEFMGFLAEGERHPARAAALGADILGTPELLAELDAEYLIGIGSSASRSRVDGITGAFGRTAAVLRHPTSVSGETVTAAPGVYLAAGAVVTTNVIIGRHSHVNVGASVSHDCEIGDWCTIAPGARLAGRVVLGDGVEVGAGAVVLPGTTVGDGAVVGAGAVVIHDVAPGAVVAGVPARPLDGHVGLRSGVEH